MQGGRSSDWTSRFSCRYISWLGDFLTGHLGVSYVSGEDVFASFLSKLPATLLLTVVSIVLTVLISFRWGDLSRQ